MHLARAASLIFAFYTLRWESSVALVRCRAVTAMEYRKTRGETVSTLVGAVFFTGFGALELLLGVTGWGDGPGGVSAGVTYAMSGLLFACGWFTVRSLRRVTRVDDAGLRLRGMFGTRVVPWSHVRYFRVGTSGRLSIVEAVLADAAVGLPGTDGPLDRTSQFAADLTAAYPGKPWLAIGLDLTPVTSAGGSRQTPLLVMEPLRYRADWALPGMSGTAQAGAPLLSCSSVWTLAPGSSARAVIIPLTDSDLSQWRQLGPGDRVRLLDGPQVRADAVVRWTETTRLPVPRTDIARFENWAKSSDDRPVPA
jgi:hypothetical protein